MSDLACAAALIHRVIGICNIKDESSLLASDSLQREKCQCIIFCMF